MNFVEVFVLRVMIRNSVACCGVWRLDSGLGLAVGERGGERERGETQREATVPFTAAAAPAVWRHRICSDLFAISIKSTQFQIFTPVV